LQKSPINEMVVFCKREAPLFGNRDYFDLFVLVRSHTFYLHIFFFLTSDVRAGGSLCERVCVGGWVRGGGLGGGVGECECVGVCVWVYGRMGGCE